jgi:phosphoribosyl 1,2-cyclic phosphodiesterase
VSVDYREHVIIFDAGSGLRQLGLVLLARDTPPSTGSLFLTHTHWDHIQGLPFFTLAFAPENHFVFYGEPRPRYSKPLRMKLTGRWGAMPLASQVERWRSHFGSGWCCLFPSAV